MSEIVSKIKYAMSLRTPQEEALSYLDAISSHCDYKKDSKDVVEAAASEYCEKQRKVKAEFDFPSFCYAMATGIGKTRLMGASIYYLYKTKGYKHFFILAPGNTIYDKLRKESNPNHPKYIFKGLEAEMGRPKVYDGENYDTYPVKFEQMSLRIEKTSEIQLFIFNIGKIFNSKTDTQFNFHKFKETLGASFADVLAQFDDLVICMDEAHRYYAPASMKAINYLKPVLGLEFTATPKTTSNVKSKKAETIGKLNTLADSYENWINNTLLGNDRMSNPDFKDKIGNKVIERCQDALSRIREGIRIIETDDTSFEAFCFMNRVIFLQNSIKGYAKKHGTGTECNFQDFINPKNPDNNFGWRPFQIAFILMNLAGIVDPQHKDREIVDLLYFPTGGGKTEAYLGLMAFVIANRRLRATDGGEYNLDGGVTVMLRYTLRLLTTQQRDRITKMVLAAEMIRRQAYPQFGKEPISIGFWVGGGVTPNKFEEFVEKPDNPQAARSARNHVYKQLLTCPFCGKPLKEENFNINTDRKSIEIFCSDRDCQFYRYKNDRIPIPVYLVDEEIYAKCPTIILSTVDKFARLPWDVNTNALFGRVDRKCSRDGYVAIGAEHGRHNKTASLPASTIDNIRPFLPPELIIQDELHLITGPLGTVYGAYETIIEDMCIHDGIKPKYVVSTATIKNAEAQTRCLYARKNTTQFPPNGFEIGDSFFIREIPVENDPFRKYVGVCAPGQSVKTALLRVYAIILQAAYTYSLQDEYKEVIDPYYSLVGYFNSIRELGGAVRLLQDDIPKRIYRIKNKYGLDKQRYLNHNVEITSRMSSYKIPEKLNQLEITCDSKECLDTAIATNMIAVGMDVDRLGLMVVTGQPKQNSEYIQATSRIGRAFPGLVVTLYNAYRPRDLSHYENFTGYHSQLYRFVEGTTATPFSARARDRVMHALVISAIRLNFPNMANNPDAAAIGSLTKEQLDSVKSLIIDRLNIIKPSARTDAEEEIDRFIDWWKLQAAQTKPLRYYVVGTERYNRLMNPYDQPHDENEKATLRSMREVESSANMFYYTEE